jgi:tungstate transport system ATP-binding protein
MAETLLNLAGLCYARGGTSVIDGITLALKPGTRTVVLGANGAGKSVLLRLMHGLIAPSAGRVDWTSPRNGKAVQAMVFQRPVVLRRSALANVLYALKLAGIDGREREGRALDALRHAGLEALAGRPARVLSGGEQQRLALARAWSLRPDVLFLDEPTASLDPNAAREVEAVIQDFHQSGTKILMTTHNLGQARRIADDIVFLHRGRVTEHTAAEAFFRKPQSAEATAFMQGELP